MDQVPRVNTLLSRGTNLWQTSVMNLEVPKVRATSLDVARRAGLSRSTVSQVLNGNDERFPQDTRDRVAAAAAELGYRPSRAGRALVTGVSDVIVVAVPNVTFGRHLQDAVDRIAQATAARGMSVVVRYAGNDEDATLTAILDLRPAAVVDLGVFYSVDARRAIQAGGTRIVPDLSVLDRIEENPNYLIGRVQARHLLDRSARELVIAVLEDDRPDYFGPDRTSGVMDEARESGHAEPSIMTIPLDKTRAAASLAAIVATHKGAPLGVCCYNDDVAIAVVAAARELGLSVPTQVAVVGVDYTAIGQLVEPPLTSIAVDMPGIIASLLGDLDVLSDRAAGESADREDLPPLLQLHQGRTT